MAPKAAGGTVVVSGPQGGKGKVHKKEAVAMTEAELKLAKEYFQAYDYSGDGSIDYTELTELLSDLNLPVTKESLESHIKEWGGMPEIASGPMTPKKGPSQAKVTKMFEGMAESRNDLAYLKISFDDFCKIWSQIMACQTTGLRQKNAGDRVTVAAIREGEDNLRQAFEAYDVDGSGALDADEIKALFEDLGLPDYDGDGYAQILELAQAETGSTGPISYQEMVRFRNMIILGLQDVKAEEKANKAGELAAASIYKKHKPMVGQKTTTAYSSLLSTAS